LAAILAEMPLWLVTVVICAAVLVIGSIFVVLGAIWLVRHQPD
jgi:multisubunit Na+/H+ antiporter MnhG subunit